MSFQKVLEEAEGAENEECSMYGFTSLMTVSSGRSVYGKLHNQGEKSAYESTSRNCESRGAASAYM